MPRLASLLALLVASGFTVSAQQPTPAFEVASIKPNTSGISASRSSTQPNAGWVGTNVPVQRVILTAYQLRAFQLVGGPDWIDSDRFDIIAKAPDGTPNSQFVPMMQSLLATRFNFKAHRETREQPIYALVLARSDGQLGPQLTRSTTDCSPGARVPGADAPPLPGERPVCGLSTSSNNTIGTMRGNGRPIADLLPSLSNLVNRVVIDKTGLAGAFDVDLRWSAEALGANPSNASTTDAPSIFTALQEQLGLKLEPSRGPVEVLVIDSVERPTPD